MKPQYEAEVIETLENTFGAVNDTTSIENVVKESIANAVEDNIADYISDFMNLGAGSDIEYSLPKKQIICIWRLSKQRVIYVMARWDWTQIRCILPMICRISNFNSRKFLMRWVSQPATLQRWHCCRSTELSVHSARKIIIDEQEQSEYNKDIKTKGVKAMSEITYTMVEITIFRT